VNKAAYERAQNAGKDDFLLDGAFDPFSNTGGSPSRTMSRAGTENSSRQSQSRISTVFRDSYVPPRTVSSFSFIYPGRY
jgi:hypothetical protein